jgi:hypothetical protein
MEGWTLAYLMIVIPERLRRTDQERLQPSLAIHQRQVAAVLAIQEQQVEHEKDQRSLASIGCVLDQVEGRFPIGQHPAKFAVQVGIPRPEASDGVGDGGVLLGPVVTSPRNDFHSACVEPSVHAISIELDLV